MDSSTTTDTPSFRPLFALTAVGGDLAGQDSVASTSMWVSVSRIGALWAIPSESIGGVTYEQSGGSLLAWAWPRGGWATPIRMSADVIAGQPFACLAREESFSPTASIATPLFWIDAILPSEASTERTITPEARARTLAFSQTRQVLAALLDHESANGVPFDRGAVLTAIRILKVVEPAGLPAPRIAWHGGDAIDFVWAGKQRSSTLTITDGAVAVLPDGRFDPKLCGLGLDDLPRVFELLEPSAI